MTVNITSMIINTSSACWSCWHFQVVASQTNQPKPWVFKNWGMRANILQIVLLNPIWYWREMLSRILRKLTSCSAAVALSFFFLIQSLWSLSVHRCDITDEGLEWPLLSLSLEDWRGAFHGADPPHSHAAAAEWSFRTKITLRKNNDFVFVPLSLYAVWVSNYSFKYPFFYVKWALNRDGYIWSSS